MKKIIYENQKETRLDNFLLEKYPVLSFGKLNKYLRENKIKVNSKKVLLSTRLKQGDEIKIFLNDDVLTEKMYEFPFLEASDKICIVYEDNNLLVADKMAGVIVNDLTNKQTDTHINRCLKYLYKKGEYNPNTSSYTPSLCHRLDTGTSGLVVVSKNQNTENFILQLFKDHSLTKHYICVTLGCPPKKQDNLTAYLTKNKEIAKVKITQKPINKFSKKIITNYQVLQNCGELSLVQVKLITGRTHQIRAHLASIGCPILGDSKYGINTENRKRKIKYQALSAISLTFPQITQKEFEMYSNIKIQVDMPWYYNAVLNKEI